MSLLETLYYFQHHSGESYNSMTRQKTTTTKSSYLPNRMFLFPMPIVSTLDLLRSPNSISCFLYPYLSHFTASNYKAALPKPTNPPQRHLSVQFFKNLPTLFFQDTPLSKQSCLAHRIDHFFCIFIKLYASFYNSSSKNAMHLDQHFSKLALLMFWAR